MKEGTPSTIQTKLIFVQLDKRIAISTAPKFRAMYKEMDFDMCSNSSRISVHGIY
jgi:hypothetical protein